MIRRLPLIAIRWLPLTLLAAVILRLIFNVQPGSTLLPPFNADNAVFVLMANDPTLDGGRLYFAGQSRNGAWPYLVLAQLGGFLGVSWPDGSLRLFTAFAVTLAALSLTRILPRASLALTAAFLGIVLIDDRLRSIVLNYQYEQGWQLLVLFVAWQAMRQFVSGGRWAIVGSERWAIIGGERLAIVDGQRWAILGVTVAAFLACWLSFVSAALLAIIAVAEASRIGRRGWPLLVAVASGAAGELLIRQVATAYYLDRFGIRLVSAYEIDPIGRWSANAGQIAALLFGSPWSIVLPLAVIVTVLGWRCLPDRRVTLALLAMTAFGLVIAVISSWVRQNLYDIRFVTLPTLFATLAIASAVPVRCTTQTAVAVLGATLLFTPWSRTAPDDRVVASAAIAETIPGAVVVGPFWTTYALAGLASPGSIIPVAIEGNTLPMPWHLEELRTRSSVYLLVGDPPFVEPPAELAQYGVRLRRADAPAIVSGPYHLVRYDR